MFLEKWPDSLPTEKCSKMLFKIKVFKEKVHRGDRRQSKTLYWSKCTFFFYFKYGFSSWLLDGVCTQTCCRTSLHLLLSFSPGRPVGRGGGVVRWWFTSELHHQEDRTGTDTDVGPQFVSFGENRKKKHALKQTCVVFRFQILYSINGCIRNMKMVGGAVSAKSPTAGREL